MCNGNRTATFSDSSAVYRIDVECFPQNEEAHDVDDRVCCANLVEMNFFHRHLVYVRFRLCDVTEYFQTFIFYKVACAT